MIYAGIGSRKTPTNVLIEMQAFAALFAYNGHTLRSGHAQGADTAFEVGHRSITFDNMQIYVPHETMPHWYLHAQKFHPAWDQCGPFAQRLHARNSAIMLGDCLDKPVDFVLCWTPNGGPTGGTGQALRIAKHHEIPVFNMFNEGWLINFTAFLKAKEPS